MHLKIYFELNDPVIGKHYNGTQKRLKLAMVSSLYPHSMCAKVERITTKTGCTSCTNWTISFKVKGFQTKTHLFFLKRVSNENSSVSKAFHFSKLILTQDFCLHSTCNIKRHILKFEPFLTSFAIFHAFNDLFELNDPVIGKHYN